MDGPLLPAWPKLTEAPWLGEMPRAFRKHTHFEPLESVPVYIDLTEGNGIETKVYMSIDACLLVALWTGRKPASRTYEMIRFYLTGLADLEQLLAHTQMRPPNLNWPRRLGEPIADAAPC